MWPGVFKAPWIHSALLHPVYWSKRHFSGFCMPFAGHGEQRCSLRLIYLVSLLLTPLMLDVVLSRMHKFSCRPAVSLRLCLEKCTIISSVPVSPVPFGSFLPHQTHSKLDPWEGKMLTWDLSSCPLSPLLGKESFSFTMICWVFSVLCSFSELTSLAWIHFWHYCLGNFFKNQSGQKIAGCPFNGMLRLNICLYLWF